MEEKKSTRIDKIFNIFRFFVIGAFILYFILLFFEWIHIHQTAPPIALDTKEKIEYMVEDVFRIKDTNNIGSYTVSFHEGVMVMVLNDVKDVHDLCFENLLSFGITEEKYNEIISIPFNERDNISSYARLKPIGYMGLPVERKGVEFRNASDSCSISIYEMNDILYCEVRTGWDWYAYKKLRSME